MKKRTYRPGPPKRTENVLFSVSIDVLKKFREVTNKQGINRSKLVSEMIDEWLKNHI